jgi:hypothetical protein
MTLCLCGCGHEIVPKRHHKWRNIKYISGHNRRGKITHISIETKLKMSNSHKGISYKRTKKNIIPKIPVLCLCGCNEVVWNGRIYKNHHQPTNNGNIPWNKGLKKETDTRVKPGYWTGKKLSKECIDKRTKSQRGLLCGDKNPSKRPEVRAKISAKKIGIPRTKETIKKMSESAKGKHSSPTTEFKRGVHYSIKTEFKKGQNKGVLPKNGYCGNGKYYNSKYQGKVFLRSSYEIAYAKWLDVNNIMWFYEFWTFDIGDTTYTPDFFLPQTETFIEIKGYLSDRNKYKIDKTINEYCINLEILFREDLQKLGCDIR